MKVFFVILFCAIAIFAQENSCKDFCTQCQEDSSEICLQIKQSCECAASSETTATTNAPLSKVNFGAFESNGNQKFEPLTKMDFGSKGDDSYTAVRQDDGSYKNQNKKQTWIIVGGIALAILTAVILGNAL